MSDEFPVAATTDDSPIRIVVAEDEAIIRLDLVETLEANSYQVVANTGRGDMVVDLVREHRPDVALLDIKMPGLDGLEVARQLTAERLTAVIIVTAFSQRELISEAGGAGAMAYIVKPYQLDDLVPAIELARARFDELRTIEDRARDLEERLEVRRLTDRAKGILMDDHGLTEAVAFRFLQRVAMTSRSSMRSVATRVIEGDLKP